MAGDLFWPAVYVAMHMDDAGLTDVKGNTFTYNGGVTRSATQSVFGGFSAYFDGVDDEILHGSLADITDSYQGAQFFCRPGTQTADNPCVLRFLGISIEYKPDGFPNGFVINCGGERTACGVHPEDNWYFIWMTVDDQEYTLYIDGLLIGVFNSLDWSGTLSIGAAPLSVDANSAFCGYVEDLLITGTPDYPILGGYVRTDTSVPTVAFYEYEPDPEGIATGALIISGALSGSIPPNGPAAGVLSFTGPAVGLVAPVGTVSCALSFGSDCDGEIPTAGLVSGRIRFTGLGAGVLGCFGAGGGSLSFAGTVTGRLGTFGAASGAIRFAGLGITKHGSGGAVSGAVRFFGSASGSTPMVPVGDVAGTMRFVGYAAGIGGVVEDYCQ